MTAKAVRGAIAIASVSAVAAGCSTARTHDASVSPASDAGADAPGDAPSRFPPRTDEAEVREACERQVTTSLARYPAIEPAERVRRIAFLAKSCSVVVCVVPNRDGDRYDSPPRGMGGACTADGDCAGVLRCVGGLCSAVQAGGKCSNIYDLGSSALVCHPSLVCIDGTCQQGTLEEGADCATAKTQCVGTSCVGNDSSGWKCERQPRTGEACDSSGTPCFEPTGVSNAYCFERLCEFMPATSPDQRAFWCDRRSVPACTPCSPTQFGPIYFDYAYTR